MNTKPQISVLIATYNRAKILHDTLEAFTHLISPPGGWELIVVDNNSNDATKDVCRAYANVLPLKYLFEKRQGIGYAFNSGIRESKGDLIVFTGDDITPDPMWLLEYEKGANKWKRVVK